MPEPLRLRGALLDGGSGDYESDPVNNNPGTITLDPVTYIAAGSSLAQTATNLVNQNYPAPIPWAGASVGGAATGQIEVTQHSYNDGSLYGAPYNVQAILQAKLKNSGSNSYRWLQIVETNSPKSPHTSSPYIDDGIAGQEDNLPFYYDNGHESPTFYDTPARTKPLRNTPQQYLHFNLFLCEFTANNSGGVGSVAIHDGIRWGFEYSAIGDTGTGGSNNSIEGAGGSSFQAVPEPGTLGLLGLGLAALLRRRKV